MALSDLQYISLKNTRLTWNLGDGSEVLAMPVEIGIEYTAGFFDRTPGSSWFTQEVPGELQCRISVKGWQTGVFSLVQLVPFTKLSAFTVLSTTSGNPSVLPANFFTWFPVNKMCLGNTKATLNNQPSQWETEIRMNVYGAWGSVDG